MGDMVSEMFKQILAALLHNDKDLRKEIVNRGEVVDFLEESIIAF